MFALIKSGVVVGVNDFGLETAVLSIGDEVIECDYAVSGMVLVDGVLCDSVSAHKSAQKTIIRAECGNQITSTFFISSAHTAGYEYDCREVDQTNLEKYKNKAKVLSCSVGVYAHDGVEFIEVQHTLAQLEAVDVDMINHIESKRSTLYSAISSINALNNDTATCADVDAIVNAIVW